MSDSSSNLSLTEEQRTELVAYLDGELAQADAERVRKLLADNAEARREAEELTVAWEALDSLEEVQASGDFTQRTMTSIEAMAETERVGETAKFNLKRGSILGGWMLGILASAVAGFCLTNWSVDDESQRLVRDLELIKSLPKYERVQSVELLERIDKEELFDAGQ